MKIRQILSLSLATILTLGIVGCGKTKEIDLTQIENIGIHSELQERIDNMPESEALLNDYGLQELFGMEMESVTEFTSSLNEVELEYFKMYGKRFNTIVSHISNEENEKKLNNVILTDIKDLLEFTYNNSQNVLNTTVNFAKLDYSNKINEFLEENDIEITNIELPDEIEVSYRTIPIVATYTYTISGKVNKKEFTKEIKQDFYFSPKHEDFVNGVAPNSVPYLIDGVSNDLNVQTTEEEID